MPFDVLFERPNSVNSKNLDRKQEDVKNSATAALISGTLTGLAICLGFSKGYTAILAVFTIALISCWHNEFKRLAIMKTIPIKDDGNSPRNDSSSQCSSPTSSVSSNSPQRPSTRHGKKAAISAPPTTRRSTGLNV